MMEQELSFEDLFGDFEKEFSKFIIKCKHNITHYKDDRFTEFDIVSVNDYSIIPLQTRLRKIVDEGFRDLNSYLKTMPFEHRVDYLKWTIAEGFQRLRGFVEIKTYTIEENEWEDKQTKEYYGFKNVEIIGDTDSVKYHTSAIEYKAHLYTNVWLNAIKLGADKVDFLINQIELMPQEPVKIKDKDTITIFFSWQSDLDDETKFLRTALYKLQKEFKASGVTIEIESDMRNTAGTQDIPNTLFQKIRNADVFIADVNIAYQGIYREALSPNPNVMIELGYAAGSIGWDKMILYMNKQHNELESLPFDIRQRSILWHKNDPEQLYNKLKEFFKAIIKK